jgi:hypothetical protein
MQIRTNILGLALALLSVSAFGCSGRDASGKSSAVDDGSGGGQGSGPDGSGGTSLIIPDNPAGAGGVGDICAGENPPDWCDEGMFVSSGPA